MVFQLMSASERITDNNGKPVPGAKLYVYDEGTTDDAATFYDTGLSNAHAQPVVCNSGGFPSSDGSTKALIYVAGGQNYKIVARNAADTATLWTQDSMVPLGTSAGTLAVASGGTGATTASGARTNLGAAAASDLTTVTSTVTTIANERGALNGGSISALAGYDAVTPALLASGFKRVCVQEVYLDTPSNTSLTTALPADTSVPTNTEGTLIFSQAITPIYADSLLEIECMAYITVNGYASLALFQSLSSNAISAAAQYQATNNNQVNIRVMARLSTGSTDEVTITARAGPTSGTATLNGLFGASCKSFLRILELQTSPIS